MKNSIRILITTCLTCFNLVYLCNGKDFTIISPKNNEPIEIYYTDFLNDGLNSSLLEKGDTINCITGEADSVVEMYNTDIYKNPLIVFPNDSILIIHSKHKVIYKCINCSDTESNILQQLYSDLSRTQNNEWFDNLPVGKNAKTNAINPSYGKKYKNNTERDSYLFNGYLQKVATVERIYNTYHFQNKRKQYLLTSLLCSYLSNSLTAFRYNSLDTILFPKLDSVINKNSTLLFDTDSLLVMPTYRAFLSNYIFYKCLKLYGQVTYTNIMKTISSIYKFKTVKDRLYYMEAMSQIKSQREEPQSVISTFDNYCENSLYKALLTNEVDFKTKKSSIDTLKIVDAQNETYNFFETIKQHKDSIILVDIWATWCSPCLQEEKYIYNLKEKLKKEKIVFLSLSVDQNYNLWLAYLQKHPNIDKRYNFLIKGGFETSFLKQNKINTIPRFILIGVNGEIVNIDAPRPSNPVLYKMIQKNLHK